MTTTAYEDNFEPADDNDYAGSAADPNDMSSPTMQRSFTQIDNDEEEDARDKSPESPTATKGSIFRRRASGMHHPNDNDGANTSGSEEEIARGFDENEMQLDNGAAEQHTIPTKKQKSSRNTQKKTRYELPIIGTPYLHTLFSHK